MSKAHEGEALKHPLSTRELCELCQVEESWLEEFIMHGPLREERPALYASASIVRVRKAKRLERDFELNAAGAALVLELLDEIERLRAKI